MRRVKGFHSCCYDCVDCKAGTYQRSPGEHLSKAHTHGTGGGRDPQVSCPDSKANFEARASGWEPELSPKCPIFPPT